MRYFKLDVMGKADQDLCFIDEFVEGIRGESWRVGLGDPLAPVYPQDARLRLAEDFPGIQLTDLLGNCLNMLACGTAFKEAVELHCAGQRIEYLPFTLYDHRGRVHSRDCFIINPPGHLRLSGLQGEQDFLEPEQAR